MAADLAHVIDAGGADNPVANALRTAALNLDLGYLRIDCWGPFNGPLFNTDIEHPEMDQPAAFACANGMRF